MLNISDLERDLNKSHVRLKYLQIFDDKNPPSKRITSHCLDYTLRSSHLPTHRTGHTSHRKHARTWYIYIYRNIKFTHTSASYSVCPFSWNVGHCERGAWLDTDGIKDSYVIKAGSRSCWMCWLFILWGLKWVTSVVWSESRFSQREVVSGTGYCDGEGTPVLSCRFCCNIDVGM